MNLSQGLLPMVWLWQMMVSLGRATVDIILGTQAEDQTLGVEEGSPHGLTDPGVEEEDQEAELRQEEDPLEEEDHQGKQESGARSSAGFVTTRGHHKKCLRATRWPSVAG